MRVACRGTAAPTSVRYPHQMFDLGIHQHSSGALAVLAASAFLAALARGFSGFGSALIFVPLASTAIGPQAAAPLLLIIDGVAAAGLIPNAWRQADKRDVGTMSIGALAGVPLGAWILIESDPLLIRWGIALFATLVLALLMSGWRFRGRPTAAISVGIGAVAGLLGEPRKWVGRRLSPTGSAGPFRPRPCVPISCCISRLRR
jgi:hypothetical protein